MMRIFLVLILLVLIVNTANAQDEEFIRYNGKKYFLTYSGKSFEHNGYYNQYFKSGEDFDSWTEMIAIQHFWPYHLYQSATHCYQRLSYRWHHCAIL